MSVKTVETVVRNSISQISITGWRAETCGC